jgi:K+-sensing histidine kinase KdpD
MVQVDPNAVSEVLASMLGYALRCSPPEGNVDVELVREAKAGWRGASHVMARLSVRHYGRAVDPGVRPPLFGQSFAADATGYASVVGIWFYVSRRLMELHQGELALDWPAGGGVRVTMRLPVH